MAILPPDRFTGELSVDKNQPIPNCSFYEKLPSHPNVEQIKKLLAAEIVGAMTDALPKFKLRLKSNCIRHDLTDEAMENAFRWHASDIAYALRVQFEGNELVLSRIQAVYDNPEVAGLDPEIIDSGVYHMGYIYGIYWYGITGTAAEPHVIVQLNHAHADTIQNIIEQTYYELGGKKPRSRSNWTYLLTALLLGAACFLVYKLCS